MFTALNTPISPDLSLVKQHEWTSSGLNEVQVQAIQANVVDIEETYLY